MDLKPNLTTTSLTYFNTERDFLESLSGLYATFQTQLSTYILLNEVRSDNTCVYYNPSERAGGVSLEEIDEFRDGAINTSSNYWNLAYSAIYRINLFLSKIDDFSFTTSGLKTRIEGEGKFIRAFYYFNLVRFYGDVPLILTPIQNLSEAFIIERTPSDLVYNQIIEDVNVAVGSLPESYSPSEVGRITRGAALTLLAKVQLTQGKFPDAVSTLKDVLAIGYTLQPDYRNCFDPNFKNNSEAILEI
ncbi:MAG: RagB/SusD family nutrient uptake outer membrane protein, partial [Candidatus Kuenenia stuttgartiensis]|nr:RagB/SusD family nutrient uptake outer membrane protein [Candidatus Kuenenia stuttgartiensis]